MEDDGDKLAGDKKTRIKSAADHATRIRPSDAPQPQPQSQPKKHGSHRGLRGGAGDGVVRHARRASVGASVLQSSSTVKHDDTAERRNSLCILLPQKEKFDAFANKWFDAYSMVKFVRTEKGTDEIRLIDHAGASRLLDDFLSRFGFTLSDTARSRIFSIFDDSGDGYISKREFIDGLRDLAYVLVKKVEPPHVSVVTTTTTTTTTTSSGTPTSAAPTTTTTTAISIDKSLKKKQQKQQQQKKKNDGSGSLRRSASAEATKSAPSLPTTASALCATTPPLKSTDKTKRKKQKKGKTDESAVDKKKKKPTTASTAATTDKPHKNKKKKKDSLSKKTEGA